MLQSIVEVLFGLPVNSEPVMTKYVRAFTGYPRHQPTIIYYNLLFSFYINLIILLRWLVIIYIFLLKTTSIFKKILAPNTHKQIPHFSMKMYNIFLKILKNTIFF